MKVPASLALVLLVAACSDVPPEPPTAPLGRSAAPVASEWASNEEVALYWRTRPEDGGTPELWAYRTETELGVNAHYTSHFPWAADVQTKLIRHSIFWDWPIADALDSLAAAVAAAPAGSMLLIIVHSENVCVPSGSISNAVRDAKYQEYADYVATLAAAAPRTGSKRVLYWQLFNEMDAGWTNLFGNNSSQCTGDGASQHVQGQRYASMLARAYPAIKSATNNEAFVVMGGLSLNDQHSFIEGMYAGGGRASYDIAAVQPYWSALGTVDAAARLDSVLAQYGDAHRPIFMTEFGVATADENAHWQYWQDVVVTTRRSKTYNKIFGYVLCGGAYGNERLFSLRRTTGAPGPGECSEAKPAFTGLAAANFNYWLHVDSLRYTDIVVRRPIGNIVPVGYSYVNEGTQFRILNVPVNFRQPTRITFQVVSGDSPRLDVQYRVYLRDYGWTDWASDSGTAGTTGIAQPMNGIQVRLANQLWQEHISYRVYQNGAWSPWVSNGATAGNLAYQAEAFQALVGRTDGLPANVSICYYAHVTVAGWLTNYPRCDGAYTGWSLGSGWRMEAMRMWIIRTGPPPSGGGSVTISGPSAIPTWHQCTWNALPSFSADTYAWSVNGQLQPGATGSSFSLAYGGSFELTVQASNSYGGYATASYYVNVGSASGCEEW